MSTQSLKVVPDAGVGEVMAQLLKIRRCQLLKMPTDYGCVVQGMQARRQLGLSPAPPRKRPRGRGEVHDDTCRAIQTAHAALGLRWRNMMGLAWSSISVLKVNLSFSATARAAAGLAETSSASRLTSG